MSIMHKAIKMALMRTMRVPMPEMIRLQAVSVSTSAAPPQVRPGRSPAWKSIETQATARMTRATFSNISPISASLTISGGRRPACRR